MFHRPVVVWIVIILLLFALLLLLDLQNIDVVTILFETVKRTNRSCTAFCLAQAKSPRQHFARELNRA